MKNTEIVIRFNDVKKTFNANGVPINAVNGVSFDIKNGEFCVILGPSGAGKTTLLNLLGGIDIVSSGEIFFHKEDITKFNKKQLINYRRHNVGFIFQFYNLIQDLTALENVELATTLTKDFLDPLKTLEHVGLKERADYFPAQCSGGEQQRISISRAIAKNPDLLLADEPTGALDDKTGKKVLELLYNASKKRGHTVVLITHNIEISKIADRIIKMKNGNIQDIQTQESPLPVEELTW